MTENTTPEARREAAAEPAADQPMLYWNVPVLFHSLGLELPEEDREAHIAEVAREVWVGGTDFQRDTVASWYRDIARTAAAAGAVYSGFLLGGLDDGRISTGTLVIQVDQVDTADAEAVVEARSRNCSPSNPPTRSSPWTPRSARWWSPRTAPSTSSTTARAAGPGWNSPGPPRTSRCRRLTRWSP